MPARLRLLGWFLVGACLGMNLAHGQTPPVAPAEQVPGQAAAPPVKAPLTPAQQADHDLIMDFITRPPVTDQGHHYASDEERKRIVDRAVENMKKKTRRNGPSPPFPSQRTDQGYHYASDEERQWIVDEAVKNGKKWRRNGRSWHYGPPRPLMTWYGVKVVYLFGGLILLTLALALLARVVSLVLHDWLLHGVKQRVPKMWEKLGRPEYCLKWWQKEGLLTGGAKARWAQVRAWQAPEVARDRRWRWRPQDLVRLGLLRWAGLVVDSTTLVIGLLVIGCAVVHLFR